MKHPRKLATTTLYAVAGLAFVAASAAYAAEVPHADKSFLETAAHNGHAEVEGSKLASTKAKNPEVKTFADQMVADHTKAGDELAQLAMSKNVKVDDGPSLTQKAELKLLSAMDGDRFDRTYTSRIGVKAHEDTVKLFQKEATSGKDPDIKAFAQKTLPTLQHHLEMAQSLQASVDPKKSSK